MERENRKLAFFYKQSSAAYLISNTLFAMENFPLLYALKDGTHVLVNELEPQMYEFHLTRLNSEKYNFTLTNTGQIEDNYELRFNEWEREALALFLEKIK